MNVSDVIALFENSGHSQYGGEAVSQLEHALQCAALAAAEEAPPSLIAAALLHDIGHLLHELPEDAPDSGIDDRHEVTGGVILRRLFPEQVTAPIALHVSAKRYLCAVDPEYRGRLSEPSQQSLQLQGGPMTQQEVLRFESHRFGQDAVRLRNWDDRAKVPGLAVPPLTHYAAILTAVALESALE